MGHCYSLPTPITAVFSPLLSSIRNRCQFARRFPFTAVFSSPSSLICHLFQYAALPTSIIRFQSAVFNLSLCHHLYFNAIFNWLPFQISAVFRLPPSLTRHRFSIAHRRSLILSCRTRKSIHILSWSDLRTMMGEIVSPFLKWNCNEELIHSANKLQST